MLRLPAALNPAVHDRLTGPVPANGCYAAQHFMAALGRERQFDRGPAKLTLPDRPEFRVAAFGRGAQCELPVESTTGAVVVGVASLFPRLSVRGAPLATP